MDIKHKLLILLFSITISAQNITPVKHKYSKGKSALNIPFELIEGHIVVKGRINGSRELKFTIDTGIPFKGIDLFHQSLAREFIKRGEKINFSLNGIEFYDQDIKSIANERLEKAPEDGLIGITLFSTCIVEIDFERSILNLYDPEVFDPKNAGVPLDIDFTKGPPIPKINAVISVDGKEEIKGLFSVDLGSGNTLSILPGSEYNINPPEGAVEKVIGASVSGEIRGKSGQIHSVKLGNKVIKDVTCLFFSKRVFGRFDNRILGIFGTGFLKNFKATFDYSNRKLYFRPIY